MREARAQTVLEVRAALSHALGEANRDLEEARGRHEAAVERQTRVRRAAEQNRVRLALERDRRLVEIDHQHHADLASLADAALHAAVRAAPGAAAHGWSGWHRTPVARTAAAPELRVGRLRLPHDDRIPALVPLLDRGHVTVRGDSAAGDDVVAGLLLRALGTAPAGSVRLIGYDPEHLGGGLAGFAPLATAGLLSFVGPGGLTALLDDLVGHVRRINETVLAGEHPSLRALAAATGRRPEPWRIAVLLGGGHDDELTRHERNQLDRLLRTGAACGVHLVVRGIPVPDGRDVEAVDAADGPASRLRGCGSLPVRIDPAPPQQLVTATCRRLAEEVAAGPAPVELSSLLPELEWQETSASALTAPLGDSPQGGTVRVTLSDYPPHALIAGPSGTGKTNLIYAWMGALATRYAPSELEFYLLDFKEGVSFARFAPGRRDRSWLPHVRLVGVNVNTDREFGLALLRFLAEELRRRADAAKRHEATNLAELRAENPQGSWPRVVAVVDEFQVLLAGRDAVAKESVDLLEDLARRGRSQGIHLVLASQDVSGIEALWGRPALVAQFSLRIALPRARRVLAETNLAAEALPRFHAVVNADSGAAEANQVVKVPAAGGRQQWGELQNRLWRRRPPGSRPPRLFDGDAVPRLADSPDLPALRPAESVPAPVALLGETIDVNARSARMVLRRAPGRNLAVLGTRVDEACAVLDTAVRTIAAQFVPGTARFSIACLDADAAGAADAVESALPEHRIGRFAADTVDWLLEDLVSEVDADQPPDRPHFVVVYAADAAPGGQKAARQLRRVLARGPERRVHVLGWWRGANRLRETLGQGTPTDAIGAWVALDVHGSELTPFHPGNRAPSWYPRPWRALHFDRAEHRGPEVLIPYGPLMTLDPVNSPEPDYRAVLAELTALDDRAAAHRAEAERWYAERAAVADEAEREAEEAVRQAVRAVRQAQRDREEVDARAANLWFDFVHRVGPAAERFGRTVPPSVLPRQRGERGAQEYLQDVATRLAYTPPARPFTGMHQVLLGLFGAAAGALGYALAHGLRVAGREAGGDWAVALPVVALIVMLVGPTWGIAAAKPLADRRGVTLDAAAVAVVLLTGTVVTWSLHLALR